MAIVILSSSYWIATIFVISDKPIQISVLEDEQAELDGLDKSENGLEAYPEFTS